MTLDSKPSNPYPPNPGQVIDSYDETETIETLLEDYYEAKINKNNPNFYMIREIVKEERKYLHARINIYNKSDLPY